MPDKRYRLGILHGLVNDIKRELPNENVWVDDKNVKIVWGKPSGRESSIDKYKKNYPWI